MPECLIVADYITPPLQCLERTCLLLRLPCSPESSAGQGEAGGTSMLLEDFCLEDSELRDVETFDATLRAEALRGRRQLEESTGFSLNHPRTSNKENKVLSAAKRKCFSSLLANEEKTKKRSSQISESDSNHSKVSRSYIASDDDDLIFEDSLPSGGNVNCTADVNGTSKRRKRSSQSLTTGRL